MASERQITFAVFSTGPSAVVWPHWLEWSRARFEEGGLSATHFCVRLNSEGGLKNDKAYPAKNFRRLLVEMERGNVAFLNMWASEQGNTDFICSLQLETTISLSDTGSFLYLTIPARLARDAWGATRGFLSQTDEFLEAEYGYALAAPMKHAPGAYSMPLAVGNMPEEMIRDCNRTRQTRWISRCSGCLRNVYGINILTDDHKDRPGCGRRREGGLAGRHAGVRRGRRAHQRPAGKGAAESAGRRRGTMGRPARFVV